MSHHFNNKELPRGSIDFEKKGGICCTFPSLPCCCNFNPAHYCCPVPDYFHLTHDNVLLYGEEPGPGCLQIPLCPLFILSLVLITPCLMCCPQKTRIDKIPYYGCGFFGAVNFHGLTFTVNNGKIDCKTSKKFLCREDLPVVVKDIQDIRIMESPEFPCKEYVPGSKHSSPYFACYDKLEILHRNAEGQIVVFQSFELKSPRHAEAYFQRDANSKGFFATGQTLAREPLPPSLYCPYVAKVQAYISSNMNSASLASRVTFAMYDANIYAQMLATRAGTAHLQQQPVYYPVQQQQQIMHIQQQPQLQQQQDQHYHYYPVQPQQVVPMSQQPQQYHSSMVSTMPATAAQNTHYYYPPPGQQEMQRGYVTMASVVSVVQVETEMVGMSTNNTTGIVYMGVAVAHV